MSLIPSFDERGLLPPIFPAEATNSEVRSPYEADVLDFCGRFGTSLVRCELMLNLLTVRGRLIKIGLEGFQWIDGSFVEDIERIENRSPRDIDVVTYANLGDQEETLAKDPNVFKKAFVKENYSIDQRILSLDISPDADYMKECAFWYSLWSHRRREPRGNVLPWKGFVQVPLPCKDAEAEDWLRQRIADIQAIDAKGQAGEPA